MTTAVKRVGKTRRWVIRVTYSSGAEAYLRHGARVGLGEIVVFKNHRQALKQAEMVEMGLDVECEVKVVKAPKVSG